MIINSLHKYYELLAEDEKSGIPLYGYSNAKVGFALNISPTGELLDVIFLKVEEQVGKKKKLVLRTLTVPEQIKRSGTNAPANFSCDNSKYVLGIDKNKNLCRKEFLKFKELHHEILLKAQGQAGKALLSFLENWNIEAVTENSVLKDSLDEIISGNNLVFRIDGKTGYIHNDLEVKRLWEQFNDKDQNRIMGQCLVTGEISQIERIHNSVKGLYTLPGKQPAPNGWTLVAVDKGSGAFESYGKTQSYNSPISKYVAFSYTTVLNYMLSRQKQKIQVGDATTVFWAESSDEIYNDLAAELFNPSIKPEGKENKNSYKRDIKTENLVKDVLLRAKNGMAINNLDGIIDPQIRFNILGLSPNASRVSVRFFHSDSFGGFVEKTTQHYQDMEIVKDFDNQPDNLPIWMILRETVSPKSRDKDANPLLAGAVLRSVINGTTYPAALFNAIMIRVRTDIDDKDSNIRRINYVRAAIIKAYLLRNARVHHNKDLEEVLTVGLNEKSTNTAYLLGRLFSVLEKAQQDANPGINATIKERYFASACATPAAVFPILLRLAQHHIAKSDYDYAIDRRIEPIMNEVNKFPSHLTLEQQGTFVLGYYHQRVALFQKSEKQEK